MSPNPTCKARVLFGNSSLHFLLTIFYSVTLRLQSLLAKKFKSVPDGLLFPGCHDTNTIFSLCLTGLTKQSLQKRPPDGITISGDAARLAGTMPLWRMLVAATPRRRRVSATPPSSFFQFPFGLAAKPVAARRRFHPKPD
jgi:hypothetical protein